MVKFILWVTMCIGGQCADLSKTFNTHEECRNQAQNIMNIIQEHKVELFIISCNEKRSI